MRKLLVYTSRLCSNQTTSFPFFNCQRKCSSQANAGHTDHGLENFDAMVARRRSEAQRSIVVELPNGSTAADVWRECTAVGEVSALMQYDTDKFFFDKVLKKFLVVEFSESDSVTELMRHSSSAAGGSVPVRSPFFSWMPQPADSPTTTAVAKSNNHYRTKELPKVHREKIYSDEKLHEKMFTCSSISEQMQLYYDHRKLTELGNRLRFLACRQIEVTLSGPLPYATATPFGSSVNGFGHTSSDLDVVLELQSDRWRSGSASLCPGLVLQTPSTELVRQRSISHRYLELVADLLANATPGCRKMIKILQARVPIVKYQQQLTGLDCDLSMNNWSGIYMSEMLYHYSLLDRRVGPLVFCLRLWAKRNFLTSQHPGRWITNFSITMLALYYLVRVGLLPPLQLLQQHARPEDKRVGEEDLDCSFLRDLPLIKALHQEATKDDARSLTLDQLLHGFFAFYDEFDFANRGLGIIEGKSFVKPLQCGMYIQNPLDPSLNVSRNVTLEEVDRFSLAVSRERHSMIPEQAGPESSSDWGLLSWSSSKEKPRTPHLNVVWSNIFSNQGAAQPSPSAQVSRNDAKSNNTGHGPTITDPSKQSIIMRADAKSRESTQPSFVSAAQQPHTGKSAQTHQHHVVAKGSTSLAPQPPPPVRNNNRNSSNRRSPKYFVDQRKSR